MRKKKHGEKTVVHAFATKPSQLKEVRQAAFDSDMSISKYTGSRDEDHRYYWAGLR